MYVSNNYVMKIIVFNWLLCENKNIKKDNI